MKYNNYFSLKQYSAFSSSFLLLNSVLSSQVVYVDIVPDIELQMDGQFEILDIDDNGVNDFAFLKTSGDYFFWNGSSSVIRSRQALWAYPLGDSMNGIAGAYLPASTAGGGGLYVPSVLSLSELINSDLNFQNANLQLLGYGFYAFLSPEGTWHEGGGNWHEGIEDGYVGIRFVDEDACNHYGWIRCTTTDSSKKLILKDYAYDLQCNHPLKTGDTTIYVGINNLENNLNTVIYSFEGMLYIRLNKKAEIASINIFDVTGDKVFTGSIIDQYTRIKFENRSGMFVVQIVSEFDKINKTVFIYGSN